MYINDTVKENMQEFIELDDGDVFKHEGNYYMKITIPKNLNNAVDLNYGKALFFNEDKMVTLVDHELVIK